MRSRIQPQRRGVTLLFVVSMIVLFLLMGTTFVVVSNDFFRDARKRSTAELYTIDRTAFVERTLYNILRGPELTNTLSPFRAHDLLSDQYGYGFRGVVDTVNEATRAEIFPGSGLDGQAGDQFLVITLEDNEAINLSNPEEGRRQLPDSAPGFFNGMVLTFVSGPGDSVSTRILRHTVETPSGGGDPLHRFFVLGVPGLPADLTLLQQFDVIINGREFSGFGAGGLRNPPNNNSGNSDELQLDPLELPDSPRSGARLRQAALLPNRIGESLEDLIDDYLGESAPRLSPNESYDAADFQNMFLSGRDSMGNIIPSFDRASLREFHSNDPNFDQQNRSIQATFRPIKEADSQFPFGITQGNLAGMNVANCEVDTDLDGELDSVFIDPGYGVMSDENGRNFKPLVAVRIVDLDGRLNLNAVGNLTELVDNRFIALPPNGLIPSPDFSLPRGEGYGPPEISLRNVLSNNPGPDNRTDYQKLLQGGIIGQGLSQRLVPGRYGIDFLGSVQDSVPGNLLPANNNLSSVGRLGTQLIGYPRGTVSLLNNNFGTVGNLFASSPMNVQGRFAIGSPLGSSDFADPNAGNFNNSLPIIDILESTDMSGDPIAFVEFDNNPYEMSFGPSSFSNVDDSPFSAVELERILRQFDIDSQLLPDRLAGILETSLQSNPNLKDLVTTDSFEIPLAPQNLRIRLFARLTSAPLNLDPATAVTRANEMLARGFFAPELIQGLKMDVNRVFGNGLDDNGDGVVDNPAESDPSLAANQVEEFAFPGVSGTVTIPADLDNDGNPGVVANDPDGNELNVRTLFAKHLYMLALLLVDEVDIDEDRNVSNEFQRSIAQWAINVVDFRDPDSIMTRFAFDPNPWDGTWDVEASSVNNPQNVVWGCERPELLITETLGVHPRRTEDLTTDPSGDDVENDMEEDFDQRLRPEPFAFIELYNPWTQNRLNQQFDASLYGDNGNGFGVGVALDRRSAGNDSSPVWRMVLDRPARNGQGDVSLRFVYFVDPMDSVDHENAANVEIFFSSMIDNNFQPLLRPGVHAVVGNLGFEDPDNAGQFRSFMGRRNMADEDMDLMLNTTRHIRIDPSNNGLGTIAHIGSSDPNERNALIIPIDQARTGTDGSMPTTRPFSVSDPFGGYPGDNPMGRRLMAVNDSNGDSDGFEYQPPFDEPLDRPNDTDNNRDDQDLNAILADDGTSQAFRNVRLQRLANPLLPWNANTNPYLTIDSMEMDLVAFNGINATTDDPLVTAPTVENAVALERGQKNVDLAPDRRRQLWNGRRDPGDAIPSDQNPGRDQTHAFEFELRESLGMTNDAYLDPDTAPVPGNDDDIIGNEIAFAWLMWNNRPYVSQLELANVPFLSSAQLTQNFSIDEEIVNNPFDVDSNMIDASVIRRTLSGRFGHLLNFFATDGPSTDEPDLYRIMEYVEVPSRFLGTQQQLSPTVFPNAPFNRLSRYRVPGKINLNTIYCDDEDSPDVSSIWNALQGEYSVDGSISEGLSWEEFRDSRRGPGDLPTDFGNPFRPAGTGNNVPLAQLVSEGPNSTLFRASDTNSRETINPTGMSTRPLFDFNPVTENRANNSNRSAYFRNAQRQRLGNLVTTRSSVFAIWITVAYFEVDEDGNLGAEIGSETGEAVRNRGFYIFDRSIPVAFEPGRNHNIEQAILVRNVIE